jgi:hypothetical protein
MTQTSRSTMGDAIKSFFFFFMPRKMLGVDRNAMKDTKEHWGH